MPTRSIEEWRTIPSDPLYQASSFGRVRNSKTYRKLKPRPLPRGYLRVSLKNNRDAYIHRVVAEAFIGPPPDDERTAINHIDGDKTNNRPENLEWVTNKENTANAIARGAFFKGSRVTTAKLVERDIGHIRGLLDLGVYQWVIADAFGVSEAAVQHIWEGKSWKGVGVASDS